MNHFTNAAIKYAFVHFGHGLVLQLASAFRGSIFPILNLIVVTISTERVHAENDILRILGVMILRDTRC